MTDRKKSERKDDCCMTAAQQKGVYIISARKDRETPKNKVNGQRIAQAVRNTAAYKKK